MNTPTNELYSVETPFGAMLIVECHHPESNGLEPDVPLMVACSVHHRTWYWCIDRMEAWCDGGPPAYLWHDAEIVPVDHSDTQEFPF